jgi:rubrerythrin
LRRKFEDLDLHEVLALAAAVEEANTMRFTTLAELYDGYDQELHELFTHLREEEIRHTKILHDEWQRRFRDRPKPAISESEIEGVVEAVDLEHGEHAIFDDLTRESALRLVRASEFAARRFYEAAAERCPDPGLKALYLDLAAMEDGHVETLEEFDLENGKNRRSGR